MRSATILVVVGLFGATTPAVAQELLEKERGALLRAERELVSLAQYAARAKDWPGAISELRFAMNVLPDSEKAKRELARVQATAEKKGGSPRADHAAKMDKKRDKAYAKVAMALADAAVSVKEAAPDRFDRYVSLIQSRCPAPRALDKLDLAYFAPYRSWFSKADVKRLEAGEERIDGKWVSAEKVVELNRKHRDWRTPWVLADDVHEVRTTIDLRRANQVFYYVGHLRRWFLDQFAGSWDLQPPKGKLPIIVTGTRAEMEARMREFTSQDAGAAAGAAFYLQTNTPLNPCFVSFEMKAANGPSTMAKSVQEILVALTHEVTHQICFEYSKHDYNNRKLIDHHFWAVEAFANHYGYYEFDGKSWRLTKPRTVDEGGGYYTEGPFFWTQTNLAKVPTVAEYIRIPKSMFSTVENYHIGATLSWFLLEGAERKYRQGYIKLLEAIHKVKDTADLWERCLPDVDMEVLQKEFVEFVKQIELDE